MSWSRMLLLATSACGFQLTPGEQLPVDVPDAPPMVADMDGDTVLDATDNCPELANLDQRNHDSDLRGDACDLCPHIAGLTDPDVDGDGVGDACDPRPGSATEMRFAWTGFDDPGLPAGWIATFPNWTISAGKLRLDGSGRIVQVGPAAEVRGVAVAMSAEVIQLGTAFVNGQGNTVHPTLGAAAGQLPSTQEYACYMFKDTGNRIAATSFFNNSYAQSNVTWSGDFATGAKFDVVETLVANNHCEIRGAGPPTTMAMDNETIGESSLGRVGVFAAASIVELDYVFIVTAR